MNKKVLVLMLALMMIFTLSACQLAREEGEIGEGFDRLIGAYVSFEYIESSVELPLYALRRDGAGDGDSHIEPSDVEFTFEGIEGLGLFTPTIVDPLGNNESFLTTIAEGFSDVALHSKYGDNEEGLEISGKLYLAADADFDILYVNPVFQDKDGKVYLLAGEGFAVARGNREGEVYSQKLERKDTIEEEGIKKTFASLVDIEFISMNPVHNISILEMDKEANLLNKIVYSPEDIPDELKTQKSTDYIIIESKSINFYGEEKTSRHIASRNDEEFYYFKEVSKKVLVKEAVSILW